MGASNEVPDQPADAALVARMVTGDRSAVAELYERHARALFVLARSILQTREAAEDLIHDVFLEAWRHCAEYAEERGTVRAWLFMRTRSRALDHLKSAGRARAVSAEPPPRQAFMPDGRWLLALLSRMPEGQQQVLMLGYFEGLSTTEIAERLGIPAGTVKTRTRAALASLRQLLGAGDD